MYPFNPNVKTLKLKKMPLKTTNAWGKKCLQNFPWLSKLTRRRRDSDLSCGAVVLPIKKIYIFIYIIAYPLMLVMYA